MSAILGSPAALVWIGVTLVLLVCGGWLVRRIFSRKGRLGFKLHSKREIEIELIFDAYGKMQQRFKSIEATEDDGKSLDDYERIRNPESTYGEKYRGH